MKKINIICITLAIACFTACSDFLDTMPDNRTEIDSKDKVKNLLVSAYPYNSPALLMEFGTDNMMDNGAQYSAPFLEQEESYLWKPITASGNDSPKTVFQSMYKAIAAANKVLQSIQEMGDLPELQPYKGEALLCRAYGHFMLANTFCLPYNHETADRDLGMPYAIEPETVPFVNYVRGTMAQLFKQMNEDIENALPLISDDAYSVPKYHFNRRAAYAFAARFNLYYVQADKSNYQKVVDYATQALGAQPANFVRQIEKYNPLGSEDMANAYVQASEPANFLLIPTYSAMGRITWGSGPRYAHNRTITTHETFWATGPWGTGGSDGFLITKLYGPDYLVIFPKAKEFWEETDKVSRTGFAHVVFGAFTGDETLLCRAEAYAMQAKYSEAAADLDTWMRGHCRPSISGANRTLPTLTPKLIDEFFDEIDYAPVVSQDPDGNDRTIKKSLNPKGFTVEEGMQENIIHCVLHFRRLETLYDGLRWSDIKRFGIEVGHNRDKLDADILTHDDPRRAIQLPSDVISAGLEANPR